MSIVFVPKKLRGKATINQETIQRVRHQERIFEKLLRCFYDSIVLGLAISLLTGLYVQPYLGGKLVTFSHLAVDFLHGLVPVTGLEKMLKVVVVGPYLINMVQYSVKTFVVFCCKWLYAL